MNYIEITGGDFLAGGGGVTEAMSKVSGMKVKWVLNHDKIAIRTNMFNHKGVKHYHTDIYKQNEHEMESVDFIWASIECTQHSQANGGREKKIGSYMLGWELIRYIKFLNPFVIGIENVPEFKKWAPLNKDGQPDKDRIGEEFEKWKSTISALGYEYHENICNAADYGIPTRRIRYFAFFTRIELGMEIKWPIPTHNKNGTYELKKWEPCRKYINIENEGQSIFGREFNENVAKGKRNKLSENTLKRIIGGIKKYAPELYFIMQYYGNGDNVQSINSPLNCIPTKDRHALIKLEKLQFIQDYCHNDIYNKVDEPTSPQLTWQTKQLVTIEKKQFLADYYGRDNTAFSLDAPANTITCDNSKHIITANLLVQHYKGEHASNIEAPLPTITTIDHNSLVSVSLEKFQFISNYFNSNGHSESQNQSINNPLGSILAVNKKALVTAIQNGLVDFDIKMRFLEPEELAKISTFPEKYFTHPLLKLTQKDQIRLIGNAVPPEWAKIIIEPVINELREKLLKRIN